MNSCIFEGKVLHARKKPVEHSFWFNTCFFYLDLDELDDVFSGHPFYSTQSWSVARFLFRDHMAHAPTISNRHEFRNEILNVLATENITEPIGKIGLLTQLRYFGFVMNPVNFYYCFSESDQRVVAIIAEVNNTPWGEQHLYVLPQTHQADGDQLEATNVDKCFHVSPFLPVDMTYDFHFTSRSNDLETDGGTDGLGINIANFQDGERMVNVSMKLKRAEITFQSLSALLVRYPLYSWKVFAAIYWQALRLYWKKVPFFPHPKKTCVVNSDSQPDQNTENKLPSLDTTSIDANDSLLVNQ